ncbi:DNA-packaging protein [Aurantimonas sp. VKM B-3413]|uniref:DNA-packaging protein n=1 Tax=Aurantimonas sp. VKM B-3413 TaxID=2779401 RepID=UPI001E47EC8D|nr:terminase family protein [Aurantimonas sp. VKM B-3413]MCB8836106.1 terminase family protein [Aurantimonas sp. VKM B-3413]
MAAASEEDVGRQDVVEEAPASDLPPEALLSEPEFWEAVGSLSEIPPRKVIETSKPIWASVARRAQLPPAGEWRQWLMIGGRGSGKTRAGAEWVQAMAAGEAPFATRPHGRIGLIAETLGDAREVMVDGESGLLAVARGSRPVFEASRRRLVFANGAIAQIFSSEDPDALRGYQFDLAWGDELAKWVHGEACFDNLQFALRLGDRPRALFTTTPRPIPLLKRLIESEGTVTTHMRTAENAANLAPGFWAAIEARYGGTRLGRQELDGLILASREDALFDLATIERSRVRAAPELRRIVVAVDPPASSHKRSDACGIIAAGIGAGIAAGGASTGSAIYVLADASRRGAKPHEWARAAVALYERLGADRIVAEVNQGGDMVEAVIRAEAPSAAFKAVRASRGKWVRAEPVAALYEQGRVRHAGRFAELEDEMADFGPDGLSGGRSPDRLDALVWAVTALIGPAQDPRVRGL